MRGFGKKRRMGSKGMKMDIRKKIRGVAKGSEKVVQLLNRIGSNKLGKNGFQVI